MSSPSEILAAAVRPPVSGEVYAHAITTSCVVRAIPDAWLGQGVSWAVVGGSCKVVFGTSAAIAITDVAVATGTPPANTASASSGYPYADGSFGYAEIRKSLGLTHYAVIGGTTAGTITFARSTFPQSEG